MENESSELGDGGATDKDEQDRDFTGHSCWTVDLADQRFLNKVIATNRQVTEVLAVADSLEQMTEIMAAPEFRKMLLDRFGDEYLVHSGPTSKPVTQSAEQGLGPSNGKNWTRRENDRNNQQSGPEKA